MARLRTLVPQFVPGVAEQAIVPSATLAALGATSLERVEIVSALMEDFSVRLAPDELRKARNLGELADCVAHAVVRR